MWELAWRLVWNPHTETSLLAGVLLWVVAGLAIEWGCTGRHDA